MRIFFIVNTYLRAELHFLACMLISGIFSPDNECRAPFPGNRKGRVLYEAGQLFLEQGQEKSIHNKNCSGVFITTLRLFIIIHSSIV
jgi:hypothetical protein